jgi:hypothetical protein
LKHRWHVPDDLAQFGTMLVVVAGLVGLSRLFPSLDVRDRRETHRLRWLQNEALQRRTSKVRLFWIVAFSLFLLSLVSTLLFPPTPTRSVAGWAPIVFMLIGSRVFVWSLPADMDELAREHYLRATRVAYLVTVVSCGGALVLDLYWPGRLQTLVIISLLAGLLAHHLVLAVLEKRAAPRDD